MSLKVHIIHINLSDFKSLLDPDIIVTEGREIPEPADYEILVHPNPSKAWIEASPKLRAVVIPWAGIPEKTRKVMAAYSQLSVHNLHHNNFNTAELGFALLLAAAKNIIPMDQALRKNDWTPRYQNSKAILLRGRTALILGFGEIGKALGSYCLALGMTVKATKMHPEANEDNLGIEIYPDDQLHALLPDTDVLLIALPLTEKTENLITEKELSLMPKGSILINIGRGPIVNQAALYEAVKNEHLLAAGSDVWYNYPESKDSRTNTPPADKPFGELHNFVLSPHRGGFVIDVEKQRAVALANLLNTANRGLKIPNKIDLDAGY